MPREIKTTLTVDGEAAFKRSINEAQTSMRNLGTQLTLAQANFKKDGDAMKLMETRSKALNAEIGQQNEIVKALEKAVQESAKAFGENSDKTEKWQAELNRAQAKLVTLQNELTLNEAGLDRNGKAFDDSAQKAADYNATLQQIGRGVSLESISSGVGKITSGLEAAFKKAVSLANKIRETMVDAGKWADEVLTDATKYGLSVEDMQRWEYASEIVDTPVEAIVNAKDKLAKKMQSGWKDGKIDMWEMLGINIRDENGAYRQSMDVLWELGETLMRVEEIDKNDIRADAWAMEVFGKSYKELLPLFRAGRGGWEEAMGEAQVVSEEHVRALGEMDDANKQLENSWEALKMSALATLAPTFTEISNGLSSLLNEVNEWLATEEGQEAMQGLAEALKELFSGITDIKFSDAINVAKEAINALTSGLGWLNENKDSVYTALEVIAGGFALLKVSEGVLTFLKLKAGWNLATGKGLGGAGNALSGAGGSGAAGAGAGAGSSFANFLLTKAVPIAAGVGLVVADSLNNHASNDILPEDFAVMIQNGDYPELTEKIRQRFGMSTEDLLNGQLGSLYSAMNQPGGWASYDELFSRLENEYGWKAVNPSETTEDERNAMDVLQELGEEMMEAQQEIQENRRDANDDSTYDEELGDLMEGIVGIDDILQNFEDKSEGIDSGSMSLDDAAAQLRSVMDGAKAVSDRVLGVDLKQFNGLPPQLQAAVQSGAAAGVSGIRVYLDGSAVGRLVAPYVSGIFAAQIGRA